MVISIIALLIGILLPALGRAREAGKSTRCLGNQRQQAIAMNAYAAEDSNGVYLSSVGFTGGNGAATGSWYWWSRMTNLGYGRATPNFESIYMCPSGIDQMNGAGYGAHPTSNLPSEDPRSAMWVWDNNSKHGNGLRANYGVNADWFGNVDATLNSQLPITTHFGDPRYAGRPPHAILHPSELLLTFDGIVNAPKDYTRFSIRHGGEETMNVSFVDGHASAVRLEDVPDGRTYDKDVLANTSATKRYAFRITDSRIP